MMLAVACAGLGCAQASAAVPGDDDGRRLDQSPLPAASPHDRKAPAIDGAAPPRPGARSPRIDLPSTAEELPHNSARYGGNAGLGSAGEPFGTTSERGCPRPASNGSFDGAGSSRWYRLRGNGAENLVDTDDPISPPRIDTFIAVYPAAAVGEDSVINCRVAFSTDDFPAYVFFDSEVGAEYLIQVAGLDPSSNNVGQIPIRAITSDLRNFAMPLALNSKGILTNYGAFVEQSDEPLTCDATTYRETLWLRFSVEVPGTVSFTASATDFAPTVTILRAGQIAEPVGRCGVVNESGLIAQVTAEVGRGEYLVQVGDSSQNPTGGNFNYSLIFDRDVDLDLDGVAGQPNGGDCDDQSAAVRPGVREVNDNNVDDNCDGLTDPDRDEDGFVDRGRFPGSPDCNDGDPAIKPGALEIRGNRVDENCDGRNEPFPRISTRLQVGFSPRRTTRVTRLRLLDVPANTTVAVRCRGRGCPRGFTQRLTKARTSHSLIRRFRRARLRPGAVLEVRVTARGLQGRRFRYEIRSNRRPRTSSSVIGSGFSPS